MGKGVGVTHAQLEKSLGLWQEREARFRKNWSGKRKGDPRRFYWYTRLKVAKARVARREQQLGPWRMADALRRVASNLTSAEALVLAKALAPAFKRYAITTTKRAAAAVAQMAHESDGFRTTTEYASGAEYEGRRDLGNVVPGDGERFKGRGYIQVTGRANYTALSKALGHDFVAHPTDLALPKWAALASAEWWAAHGCNELADAGDFVALTRRINGGTNGLASREEYWYWAKAVAANLI